jgi:predicted dehydrogenase
VTTDYRTAPLTFRVRKGLRYLRLYGFGRTLTKIRAQYRLPAHGASLTSTWHNPRAKVRGPRDVALIGCGAFAYSTIAHYCRAENPGSLGSVFDPNGERAKALCRDLDAARAVASVDEILRDPTIRIVFIASNHASHAEYAIQCLDAGKDVHIEKPHVVSPQQLTRLIDAMHKAPERKVFLGFNRPRSAHFEFLRRYLMKESGPLMINWFVAGHELPAHHWYFSDAEGGRILGNLCHWTDLTLALVGVDQAFPCDVVAGGSGVSPSDIVLTYAFADGSSAAITFSAKGHTFEGVREYLNCHRGDALCSLQDFQETRIDLGPKRLGFRTRNRDHGHRANILNSLRGARGSTSGESREYIRLTAALFLGSRMAADSRERIRVHRSGAFEQLTASAQNLTP